MDSFSPLVMKECDGGRRGYFVAGLCETLYKISRKVRLTMVYDDIDMLETSCIKGHIHVIKDIYM